MRQDRLTDLGPSRAADIRQILAEREARKRLKQTKANARERTLVLTKNEPAARAAATIERVTGVPARPAQPKTSEDAYSGSERGKHSFFMDLAAVQAEDNQGLRAFSGPRSAFDDVNTQEARNRLASCQSRAGMNSALTSGGEFLGGSALPADIANAFAIGARTTAVVAPLFESNPLESPELAGSQSGATHFTIKIPRIGTGAS